MNQFKGSLTARSVQADEFQSQTRCASPGNALIPLHKTRHYQSFNLRREANPLATTGQAHITHLDELFQSQTRSQSTGDMKIPMSLSPISHYSGTFKQGHFPWKFPRNIPRIEKTSCTWRADVTR